LGRIDILTILSLIIHEHRVFLHLFRPYLISLISFVVLDIQILYVFS
jgi:hypothetical protein